MIYNRFILQLKKGISSKYAKNNIGIAFVIFILIAIYYVKRVSLRDQAAAASSSSTYDQLLEEKKYPLEQNDFIDLQISSQEMDKLMSGLEHRPVKKKWVNVAIKLNGKSQRAKLRFHGTDMPHYQGNKFSYTIKLKEFEKSGYNFRRFKLIKGEQANPTVIAVNRVANSFGLISTYGKMKIVRINGENKGHYYFVEDIKKEYLEREHGITNFSIINSTTDWSRKEGPHISDLDFYIGHIEKNKDPLHARALSQYRILCQSIDNNDLEQVEEMIDKEYMGNFLALATMFNDIHFMSGDNLKLIYDHGRGKFFPVYRGELWGCELKKKVYNFSDFNSFLFQSYGSWLEDCKTSQFYKLLLTSNSIRNYRDKMILTMHRKKDQLLRLIGTTHLENEKIMVRFPRNRQYYQNEKRKQLEVFQTLLTKGVEYINYSHIYGSYDKERRELYLVADMFSPVHISCLKSDFEVHHLIGIEFDNHLKYKSNYQVYKIRDKNFNPKDLIFINKITGDTIKEHIYFNVINTTNAFENRTTEQMLHENGIHYQLSSKQLIVQPGVYTLSSNVFISKKYKTILPKGVTFKLGKGVNFMIAGDVTIAGTKDGKVVVKNAHEGEAFGCFSIIGQHARSYAKINYLDVSGGGASFYQGKQFTGQFAIYNSTVEIANSRFEYSQGDDGMNAKYCKITMNNCQFVANSADQLDLDFCMATVSNCTFTPSKIDANGDGIDLSGSYAQLSSCTFSNFLDKSISIGERSKTLVYNCHFTKNKQAIAVKDQASLYAWDNYFSSNQFDYTSFVKKSIFKQPALYILDDQRRLKLNLGQKENLKTASKEVMDKELHQFVTAFRHYKANGLLSNKPI